MKRSGFLLALSLVQLCAGCWGIQKAPFNYGAILRQEYGRSLGKTIPLTIDQSVDLDGDLSADGRYFYYASDRENGNYDLFLRDLNDITTLRLTDHAARDASPAISPNGRYLAFVSLREDPEGDVYVMQIRARKFMKLAGQGKYRISRAERTSRNLTQYQDPATGTVRIIKDATPSWSPDGDSIVFASTRNDTKSNVWIMSANGRNKRRVTRDGGMYPRFSPDGKDLVFISYRDNPQYGEVYTLNLETGRELRITALPGWKFHPCFTSSGKEILYTAIDRDTNGDGRIAMKDNSVIKQVNVITGEERRLTPYSQSCFSPRWFPAFGSPEHRGVVIYGIQSGDNLNIAIMPDTGIIPRRLNAREQFELAQRSFREEGDPEKYCMALESVHTFFGNRRNPLDRITVTRALFKASLQAYRSGMKEELALVEEYLKKSALTADPHPRLALELLQSGFEAERARAIAARVQKENPGALFTPYLLEDLADFFLETGKTGEAQNLLLWIMEHVRDYAEMDGTRRRYAETIDPLRTGEFSEQALAVLDRGNAEQKTLLEKSILASFEMETKAGRRAQALSLLLARYEKNPGAKQLLSYALAKASLARGDKARARELLTSAAFNDDPADVIFYLRQALLGDLSLQEKNFSETERWYSDAAASYRPEWDDASFPVIIQWLADYYERYGERFRFSGRYREAMYLYKKYVVLMSALHAKKQFNDLYNRSGGRAHINYIDTALEWKGMEYLPELEKEYRDRLDRARLSFDKAFVFGLSYLCTTRALEASETGGVNPDYQLDSMIASFKEALMHLDWSLSMDDTYIDPYLLKSWIYQYLDVRRASEDDRTIKRINRAFPRHLWEENVDLLTRALSSNDEAIAPEQEGCLHLNMGNNFFLLENYNRALTHYRLALKFKRGFGSKIEEALFYFHMGYCYWQLGEVASARGEMAKARGIYESLGAGKKVSRYARQLLILYKYVALFNRFESRFTDAIAWYNRILAFAGEHRIDIDRARYFQEIAYCYKELGNNETALSYLERAGKLLQKYPKREKKYYVQLFLGDFGPFKIWDLGPDSAHIGDSSLFAGLGTLDKKLLNIAMQEEIATAEHRYERSRELLKEKIALHKKRDLALDRAAIAMAYNNLGIRSMDLGDYPAALSWLRQSWNYARANGNPEGAFAAIMNLAHCHVVLAEKGHELLRFPGKTIVPLVNDILVFRENYRKEKRAAELAELEKQAKSKKAKPGVDELHALDERIDQDVRAKYYYIDIAIGILRFYHAELLVRKREEFPRQPGEGTSLPYRNDEHIRELYAEALRRFNDAIPRAEDEGLQPLLGTLLLNAGVCYGKLGKSDLAYANLIDARDLAEEQRLPDLRFGAALRLGDFLREHGMDVEGEDYLSVAAEHYDRALDMAAKTPFAFIDAGRRLEELFDNAIALALTRRHWDRAFALAERKYALLTALRVARIVPEFRNEDETAGYRRCLQLALSIAAIEHPTVNPLRGSEPRGGTAAEADRVAAPLRKEFESQVNVLASRNPLLASYLTAVPAPAGATVNAPVCRFVISEGMVYALSLQGKKVTGKMLGSMHQADLVTRCAEYLASPAPDGERYIVLDRAFQAILQMQGREAQNLPPYMLIPSASRLPFCSRPGKETPGSVYHHGSGLERALAGSSFRIAESATMTREYAGYSIIIDTATGDRITPRVLFSDRNITPAIFIVGAVPPDPDELPLLMEAALYAGISTTCVMNNADPDSIARFLGCVRSGSLETCQPGTDGKGATLSIGVRREARADSKTELTLVRGEEERACVESLRRGDLDQARRHLNKWRDALETDLDAGYLYARAFLDILGGSCQSADQVINETLSFAGDLEGKRAAFLMLAMYSRLMAGNLQGAFSLRAEHAAAIDREPGSRILAAIEDLSLRGTPTPIDLAGSEATSGSIALSRFMPGRLLLLYAELLLLHGNGEEAAATVRNIPLDTPLTEREALQTGLIDPSRPAATIGCDRYLQIRSLAGTGQDAESIKNRARGLLMRNATPDALSPHAIFYALAALERIQGGKSALSFLENVQPELFYATAYWTDELLLLDTVARLNHKQERTDEALKAIRLAEQACVSRGLAALDGALRFREASLLLDAGDPRGAYNALTDRTTVKSQILQFAAEVSMNRFDAARARKEALLPLVTDEDDRRVLAVYSLCETVQKLDAKTLTTEDEAGVYAAMRELLATGIPSPAGLRSYGAGTTLERLLDRVIRHATVKNDPAALLLIEEKKYITAAVRLDGVERPRNLLTPDRLPAMIPKDMAILSLSRNGDDVCAWVATANGLTGMMLPQAFARLKPLVDEYRQVLTQGTSILSQSRKFHGILAPVFKQAAEYGRIVIAADRDMEIVPYEIIGEQDMLEESHSLLYCATLLATPSPAQSPVPEVFLIGREQENITPYLENVALRESGITISREAALRPGVAHVHATVTYDPDRHAFRAGNAPLGESLGRPAAIYLAFFDLGAAGMDDFCRAIADRGPSMIIINDAAVQDTNSAIFVESMYGGLRRGERMVRTFENAKAFLRQSREFRHPANWAGIRLYVTNPF